MKYIQKLKECTGEKFEKKLIQYMKDENILVKDLIKELTNKRIQISDALIYQIISNYQEGKNNYKKRPIKAKILKKYLKSRLIDQSNESDNEIAVEKASLLLQYELISQEDLLLALDSQQINLSLNDINHLAIKYDSPSDEFAGDKNFANKLYKYAADRGNEYAAANYAQHLFDTDEAFEQSKEYCLIAVKNPELNRYYNLLTTCHLKLFEVEQAVAAFNQLNYYESYHANFYDILHHLVINNHLEELTLLKCKSPQETFASMDAEKRRSIFLVISKKMQNNECYSQLLESMALENLFVYLELLNNTGDDELKSDILQVNSHELNNIFLDARIQIQIKNTQSALNKIESVNERDDQFLPSILPFFTALLQNKYIPTMQDSFAKKTREALTRYRQKQVNFNKNTAKLFIYEAIALFQRNEIHSKHYECLELILDFIKVIAKNCDEEVKLLVEKFLNPDTESSYKNLVKCLYSKYVDSGALRSTVNNATKELSRVLSDGDKYINELLQNADDAIRPNKDHNTALFIVLGNLLVFQHEGRHFSLRDIQGLCDTARNDSEKRTENIHTTGNKGIGFKVAFTIADTVYVFSKHAKFRLDKQHEYWKECPDEYPWYLTPIWTEANELPKNAQPYIVNHPDKVTFVFVLKNSPAQKEVNNTILKVKKAIADLTNNPERLLFLRSVNRIDIQVQDQNSFISKEIDAASRCRLNSSLENREENWFTYQEMINIPAEMLNQFKLISNLPDKYKNNLQVLIQFAAPVDPAQIMKRIDKNVLYCYLSTDMNIGMRFLVNADFNLNSERTQLKNDETGIWNQFLIEQIAYIQFNWFKSLLSSTDLWKLAPSLITDSKSLKFPEGMDNFKTAFDKGYARGINTSFIKPANNKSPLTVKQSAIDTYHFVKQFCAPASKDKLPHESYSATDFVRLIELGGTNYDIPYIIDILGNSNFQKFMSNPQNNLKMVQYIYSLSANNPEIINKFKKLNFILTTKNTLLTPSKDKVYIPSEKYISLLDECNINILNPVLKEFMQELWLPKQGEAESEENKKRRWLTEIGLHPLSLNAIVSHINDLPLENKLRFLHKVFELNEKEQLSADEYRALREVCVVQSSVEISNNSSKKEWISLANTYFGDDFEPQVKLQRILRRYPFIEYSFIKHTGPIKKWKNFLLNLNVQETITEKNIHLMLDKLIEQYCIDFVKILFDLYVKNSSLKLFSINPNDDKAWHNKVKLKTKNNQFILAKLCYLADIYRPKKYLEEIGGGINFVASNYLSEEERNHPEQIWNWHKFFILLGVNDDIKLELLQNFPYSEENHYIKYLKSLSYREQIFEYDGSKYTSLYPAATSRHTHQHHLTTYIKIQYIDQISGTSVFWHVIHDHWQMIQDNCSTVTYAGYKFGRAVLSNVHFEALTSVNKILEKKGIAPAQDLSEIYAPDLFFIGEGILKVAEIDIALTEEQVRFFKFRTELTLDDAIKLLTHFSTKIFTIEVVKQINMIYKNLLRRYTLPTESLQELKLLTGKNNFKLYTSLIGWAVSDKLIPIPESERILNKNDLSLDEYKKLCLLLKCKVIEKKDLELVTDPKVIVLKKNKTIPTLLINKLAILILPEAIKYQYITDPDSMRNHLNKLIQKLNDLKCYSVNSLCIKYEDLIAHDVSAWMIDNKMYYLESTEDQLLKWEQLYQHLISYLELEYYLSDTDSFRYIWEQVKIDTLLKNLGSGAHILYQQATGMIETISQSTSIDLSSPPTGNRYLLEEKLRRLKRTTPPALTTQSDENNKPAAAGPETTPEQEDSSESQARKSQQSENVSGAEKGQLDDKVESDKCNESSSKKQRTEPVDVKSAQTDKHTERQDKKRGLSDDQNGAQLKKNRSDSDTKFSNNNNHNSCADLSQDEQDELKASGAQDSNNKVDSSGGVKASDTREANKPNNTPAPQKEKPKSKQTKIPFFPSDAHKEKVRAESEQYIFNELLKKYSTKHKPNIPVPTADGFTIAAAKGAIELVWHNKNGESGKSKDFTLIKYGVKKIIEVKGTSSKEDIPFSVPIKEYRKAEKYKAKYSFFRVVDTLGNKRYYKIKDPLKKIKEKELEKEPESFKLKFIPK